MRRILPLGLAGLLLAAAPAAAQDTFIVIDRDTLARILQGERMEDALGGQFGRGPAPMRDRAEMRQRMQDHMSEYGMGSMHGRQMYGHGMDDGAGSSGRYGDSEERRSGRDERQGRDSDGMSRYGDRDTGWGDERQGRMRRMTELWDAREMYDANQDGRITQDEVTGARESRLAAFDENGDGALSLAEYERLWLDAMRERMVRRFQRHDRDGDGTVTKDEFTRATRDFVASRDRTGDDALDASDFDAPQHGRAPGFRGEDAQGRSPGDTDTEQGLQGIPESDVEIQRQGSAGTQGGGGTQRSTGTQGSAN